AQPPLDGFDAEGSTAQRALEAKLDATIDAGNLRAWMQEMTTHAHHLGSAKGKANAELMAGLFKSWGYETRIETFQVLFPTPKLRRLEMTAPTRFVATLSEPAVPGDTTSAQQGEQLPTYNAYSADGDVTGELVYVNYGVPEDYEVLALHGIDVEGKIVIARYGGSWRGIKPKVAAEHGAIGCIIYSDPKGDGYYEGDVYPKGGWRGERSVQRGSVMDFTEHNGDPLTPLIGATADAPRIPRERSSAITKIPTLPISYADAQPLLAALDGHVVPEAWRGALPITYHFGPGPAKVHLQLEHNWDLVPLHNVIAVLPGAEFPDQWVIRGNHHDAWVYGATDPVSGMVAVLEEARAVAELTKTGWRPRRTLIYAAWDGEEQGLLGSTEWVETHADELREKAVAYVNSDSNERGFFGAAGTHDLEKLVSDVIREVTDPETNVSVYDRTRSKLLFDGPPDVQKTVRNRSALPIAPAGSGSDFAPFVQFAGIAVLNIGYGDEGDYGQYHSIYDSFDHYVEHMDPSFQYGVSLAQTGGRLMLRLSQADLLPIDFEGFADRVARIAQSVVEQTDKLREETAETNRRIREGDYAAYFDPTKHLVVPEPKAEVPFLNFAPLQNAVTHLQKARPPTPWRARPWRWGSVSSRRPSSGGSTRSCCVRSAP
ncbi:MAG: M28 family peptidase, partial [Thermoanaerobaculia bacterium]|nr:M28 family peptidase [Thermoanaerobaculia bacterium]